MKRVVLMRLGECENISADLAIMFGAMPSNNDSGMMSKLWDSLFSHAYVYLIRASCFIRAQLL